MNNPKKPTRRYSGSEASKLDALKQAAAGWPALPATLYASDKTYWDAIMIARLPQQWANVDLLHAANLARCLADIDANHKEARREGAMVDSPAGLKINPRLQLIDTLNRRAVLLTRVLQLQAVATIGAAREQTGTKAEAGAAASVLRKAKEAADDRDSLLARPRMQ
jgi:hypothetical protein